MASKEVLYSLDDEEYRDEEEGSKIYKKYKEFSSTIGFFAWVIIFFLIAVSGILEGTKNMKLVDDFMGNIFSYVVCVIILIWGYNRFFSWINLKNKRKRCSVSVCAQIIPLKCVKEIDRNREIYQHKLGYVYEINGRVYKLRRYKTSSQKGINDNETIDINVNPNMPYEIFLDKEHNLSKSAIWGIIGGVLALSITAVLISEVGTLFKKFLG